MAKRSVKRSRLEAMPCLSNEPLDAMDVVSHTSDHLLHDCSSNTGGVFETTDNAFGSQLVDG